MNVAPVYRTVLKNLSRACSTRPHFVQDIRFLLSLPLFSNRDEYTDVPPTIAPVQGSKQAIFSESLEDSRGISAQERTTVENYLSRSPFQCYPIDTTTLFAMCYADLRSAVRQPQQIDNGVNPVAQQILRYRNLLWLRDRLVRVLADKTTEQLAVSLSVADGPDSGDFIPDAFFEATCDGQGQQLRGTGAFVPTAPRNGPVSAASGVLDDHNDRRVSNAASCGPAQQQKEPSKPVGPSSSIPEGKGVSVLSESLVSATCHKSDTEVVFSAGAIGQQCEMFVLRHREVFPMATHFLSGFPNVPASELASCAHQQAALTQLVRDKYPTAVTCEDDHVRLSVAVEPFDPQYRTREHAGMGYFATAHRQFRVQFSLQPLVLDAGEEEVDGRKSIGGVAERTKVLVVNSYFVRLDMDVMQLVEEVGYLHSRDVLRMLRERDYGDHFSDCIDYAVTDALDEMEGENEAVNTGSATSTDEEKRKSSKSSGARAFASAMPVDNARIFSLYFVNPTDAPTVLKGLLYYKLGKRNLLAKSPIRCIPFGCVLLEA